MIVTIVTRKEGGKAIRKAMHFDDIDNYIFMEARRGRKVIRMYHQMSQSVVEDWAFLLI